MEERSNRKYTLLNIEESGRKFATLFSIKGQVSLQQGKQTADALVKSHKHNQTEIYIELEGDLGQIIGEVVYGYELNGVKYLGQGHLNGDSLSIKTGSYRLEKREHERLLVWPHYKVHAYFDLVDRQQSNVESIDKATREKLKSFSRFMELKSEHAAMSHDLTGMRVLDISRSGFSFLANQNEIEYFPVDKPLEIIMDFNGEKFEDLKATTVYSVNYMNPKARTVRMYKVGMNFDTTSSELIAKLEQYLGREHEIVDIHDECKNFSEFVDKD